MVMSAGSKCEFVYTLWNTISNLSLFILGRSQSHYIRRRTDGEGVNSFLRSW